MPGQEIAAGRLYEVYVETERDGRTYYVLAKDNFDAPKMIPILFSGSEFDQEFNATIKKTNKIPPNCVIFVSPNLEKLVL